MLSSIQSSHTFLLKQSDYFYGRTQAGWLRVNPWGLRSLLRWVRDRYNNPPLYVTENGRPTEGDSLEDDTRIEYYTSYVNEMLKGNTIKYIDTTAQFVLFLFSLYNFTNGEIVEMTKYKYK